MKLAIHAVGIYILFNSVSVISRTDDCRIVMRGLLQWNTVKYKKSLLRSELQIRGGIENNSKIIFLMFQ